MQPSRRQLLRSSGGILATLTVTGCLASSDDATTPTESPATPTEKAQTSTRSPEQSTTGTPSDAERIMFGLDNDRSSAVTATVSVTGEDGILAETERTVPAYEYDAVFSGITETGSYEFAVELDDGTAAQHTFAVESYDLRMGSNVTALIREEEVWFATEE